MDYALRRQRLQESLREKKLDALLVTHLPNIHYLCGFSGSAGALVLGPRFRALFTDGRYTAQARAQVQGARVVIARRDPYSAAAEAIQRHRLRPVGIEADHLTLAACRSLQHLLGGATRLRPLTGFVERARMIKEVGEVQRIRQAVLLGARLFTDIALKVIRPGVTEVSVAAEIEYAARTAGASAMSFDTIVAAGPRSAMPHARASSCTVPRNAFVVLDFGVILADYCSDMTRTVYVGRPTRRVRDMYQAVLEAQQAAVAAVRPGATAGQVDQAARRVLRRAGLDRFFTHSTGHGVGLEIHEPPRIGRGQTELLQPGMVITIEPGVYIPGSGGVRIEDMVLVTQSGCEVLTPATKQLIAR